MNQPVLLHKPLGLTPFQAIQLFKQQLPQYAGQKISAAGRLDPMAEGLLLLLIGSDNKQQAAYLRYPKTYQTTILFGIATDSYDLLGLPLSYSQQALDPDRLDQVINKYRGLISQPYPPYSAVRVNGQPLYYWAHQNLLHTINIPKAERHIFTIDIEKYSTTSNKFIKTYIDNIIPNIQGNYRQQPIIEAWHSLLAQDFTYPTLTLTVTCSSGTYIRSLAHTIGQDLGLPALALTINRLTVGPYSLNQAYQLKPASLYKKLAFTP